MGTFKHDHAEQRGSIRTEEALCSKAVSDGAPEYPASTDAYETNTLCGKLQGLASNLKVEKRGIERVPEDERNDHSYWNIGTMVLDPSRLYPNLPPLVIRSRTSTCCASA